MNAMRAYLVIILVLMMIFLGFGCSKGPDEQLGLNGDSISTTVQDTNTITPSEAATVTPTNPPATYADSVTAPPTSATYADSVTVPPTSATYADSVTAPPPTTNATYADSVTAPPPTTTTTTAPTVNTTIFY